MKRGMVEGEAFLADGLPVYARGIYLPGAAPLPEPGEAMAVICPGWPEDVEDVEVFWRPKRKGGPLYAIKRDLTEADYERIVNALLDVAYAREEEE